MISVIIPLYNKKSIVARSIRSVLEQSYQDFELIVVDDGSTDGSAAVVELIKDNRVRLIRQENGGPSKARNTGIEHARGEWILFLDADDELAEGALEHLMAMAQLHPTANIIDGSFCVRNTSKDALTIYQDSTVIDNNYKAFFYRETLPSTGHTLFKDDLIKRHPYNEIIRRYEDVEMIMRILKAATIVTTSRIIFYVNANYSAASSARKHISEDFLGHLDFRGKSFWERMCLYQFYLWERDHYPEAVDKLYPLLRWRYDLLLLHKILHFLKKHHVL